ncbi:MAG TPA: redox-regulated ATPase YchF [Elusimicrobia bacterium]|nr:MAG: redox-regulated ATPase YchF [Elusimicrobia bacterium GWA2_66_18]OGR70895.1 MAG: redox-regulated ATPase YchF [Elusimicrobia bacterium GWC2_65_9]HAZ08847.1 redox-regulated ATPase YchF [Elusimicrobiota bacterium]
MEIGIVGLPNVGKSTIFNALTSGNAAASNYPFTTIEPNVGVVAVPDPRLGRLTQLARPKKTIPASCRFVDIAGLVKGAAQGEGLGNKFLANIREVDAVLHMVRLFKDPEVVHTMGGVDHQRDIEVIETELMLADLDSLAKQYDKVSGKAKSGDKAAREALVVLDALKNGLEAGKPARALGLDPKVLKDFFLLTAKPVLYVGNTDETPDPAVIADFKAHAESRGSPSVVICGKLESEIAQLSGEDREMFMKDLGMETSGLEKVIVAAYQTLGLRSYFTCGEIEVRAWTIPVGAKAPQAAGVIHTDFEKGFIKADVYSFEDIDKYGSEAALREKGLIRSEGKDYTVQDGDVCHFKFAN